MRGIGIQADLPELELPVRAGFSAGAVGVQTGGHNPGFAEAMVEDDEAVVKADDAIRQLEIVGGAAREFGFDEILEVVAPIAEAAAQRERKVRLLEQFVTRHETVEDVPRIAECDVSEA